MDQQPSPANSLQPLFATILADCAAANIAASRAIQAAAAIDPERREYELALRRFDAHFEFSDDHAVYSRGREALAKLREQQRRIDPAGRIWLSIIPADHGVPGPIVGSPK